MSSVLELRAAVWFIQDGRMHLLYPTLGHEPLPIHQYRRMERHEPHLYLREWFPLNWDNEYFVRHKLLDLYEAVTRRFDNLDLLTSEWLLEWVDEAFERELVTVYEKLPWRAMRDDEDHQAYARAMSIPMKTESAPQMLIAAKNPTPKATEPEYEGTGGNEGWKDELATSCPSPNWRSENFYTCSSDVQKWCLQHITAWDPSASQLDTINETLGALGGGGFYMSTTRVVPLPRNTMLYRFCGSGKNIETGKEQIARPNGGWWAKGTCSGDPREYFALPPGSSAKNMVIIAIAADDLTGLEGLGAPRCTNKPGGPMQIYIPYRYRTNSQIAFS